MSFIQQFKPDERICSCGRKAETAHHKTYRCNGGTDEKSNLEPKCFHCHHKEHAQNGDWERWGRQGGKQTARNPWNLRNLKQFRDWPEPRFEEWCRRRMGLVGA